MSNFIPIAFLDTWALSAALRARQYLFTDESQLRVVTIREVINGDEYLNPAWESIVALRNVISRIRRLNEGFELGNIRLEMLMPRSTETWVFETSSWQMLHLAIVTNPGAVMYSGVESLHMQPGWLNWINTKVPTCQVNFGEWPRIHLVVEVRKKEPEPC